MINECSAELLQLAIFGDLSPEREQALTRHLEQCEKCSTTIEQLAGGTAWCAEAAALLAGDDLDDAAPSREEWSDVDFTVEHLEPCDEPNVLGRLGGYDVLQVIGHGGMSVVLKAHDRELNRYVAVKVLAPHLAQSSLAKKRFIREAQAAAAVVHPHVIAIHQVQPNGRLPFLVMPLVAGESLAQRLAAQGRLELMETLRIGMQAAAGLAAAHEQGLVHRDVKPANILLEKGVERAVLTDFGLARAADDVSMTRWGIIAGTPQYMSPEQARGEPLDGRSDLFSLGCVLYEMATGVSPFRADSTMATLRRLIDDPPPALASLNPELPPWFVAIVDRLLKKDPAKRFSSAKEVSELLEGCLAHLQQPGNVPLPMYSPLPAGDGQGLRAITSPLPPGEGQGVRAVEPSLPPNQQRPDSNPKRQRGLFGTFLAYASGWYRRKPRILGALAMLSLIGISLFAVGVATTNPSDISGQWSGENWGQVVLTPTAPGQYIGTYTDTVGRGPGKIVLKWSRIERQFRGTWSEGEDRFGELSVTLADDEIRGALTTDPKSKINPATPGLAPFLWKRAGPPTSGTEAKVDPNISTAERFVELMSEGKFDEAMDYFDYPMRKTRKPTVLKTLWDELAAHGGKFIGRGQPRTEHVLSYDVVYVPGKWERFQLDFQFTFDEEGKIVDLNEVRPGGSVTLQQSDQSTKLVPIKKFTTADKPLSGSLAAHDGGWSATLKSPETLHLFEVANPGVEDCRLFYRAKLRTQDFQGLVYLEMWCRLPGQGEAFSRGLNNTLSGTAGWISCETPFVLKAGERPDLIRLNVVAKGAGTVQVKDVELLRTLPTSACVIDRANVEGNTAIIKGTAPAGAMIAFHAGTNRGNGWSCGFPNAGRFTATLEKTSQGLNCRVAMESGEAILTLGRVDRVGSAVLSAGQLDFAAGTPTVAPDGASTVTLGQWTAKSGEKVAINVTLSPPEKGTSSVIYAESRDASSAAAKALEWLRAKRAETPPGRPGFEPIITLGNLLGIDPLPELIKQEIARQLHDAGADYDDLQVSVAEERDSATPFAVMYKGLRHFKYTFGGKPDPKWPEAANGQFIVNYIGGGKWQGKLGDTQFTVRIGKTDNIDLPFVNDPAILGQWKAVDFVAAPAEFDPGKPSWKGEHFFQGLTFLPGGKTSLPWFTWTRGVVIHRGDETAARYEIHEIKGQKYLFMEWKNGDVTLRGQKPRFCVMLKVEGDAGAPSKVSADQIVVEDLALQMIVAIREKDDKKLRSYASDRIKAWPDALPTFAVELRERYRQNAGNERFDLRASETLVDGDLAAVRCTGPKELEGKCLVLYFVKSGGHWLNYSLRAGMESVPLADFMTQLKKQMGKQAGG